MEYFAIAETAADEAGLQDAVTVSTLPDLAGETMMRQLDGDGDAGELLCIWGRFRIERQRIRGGVRFTLPTCPNALAVTVTTGYDPAPAAVVIHATINRTDHDPDFLETIEDFTAQLRAGLEDRGPFTRPT